MSSKIHTKNEKKMKKDTLGFLPFKGPGYLFVSFNHQGVASLLQWRHTRWLKETPSPSPKDPLHSFQVKLNYPPCLFEDVQCAHTSLTVQINPWPISVHAEDAAFVPAPRQKAYTKHLRPAPGME